MKIKTELSLVFLVCGIIPLVICAAVNYYSARSSSTQIVGKSQALLEESIQNNLEQVQESKIQRIKGLAKLVNDQLKTFSSRIDVVQACQSFSNNFGTGEFHQNVTEKELKEVESSLAEFYSNEFGKKYKKDNAGKAIDTNQIISKLDQKSRLMQYEYISSNQFSLGNKDQLMASEYRSPYTIDHEKFHPVFRDYLRQFQYYDIFICDIQGRVVYSVFKELDYGTSLVDGPFSNSNLAEAFTKTIALKKGETVSVDFRPYQPSYDAPAGFSGSPIYSNGKLVGAAIFQVPLDRINQIMIERGRLGETGESYLIGSDKIIRSDCFRDPKNRSLNNAFRDKEKAVIDTPAVAQILQGKSGFLANTKNYLNEDVLAFYSPLGLPGLQWGMVTEITRKEALAPVAEVSDLASEANSWFLVMTVGGLILSSVVIIVASNLLGNRFSSSVRKAVSFLEKVAKGDLSGRLPEDQQNEFGQMASSLNQTCDRIGSTIGSISNSTDTLNNASVQLSSNSESLSSDVSNSRNQTKHVSDAVGELSQDIRSMTSNSEQMSANMRSVATGVEQMTQTIAEIAGNAEQSASVAQEAAQLATVSNSQISDLGSAADEIGKVIEVIQDIAEQTNLLALNATIEAARAGEAGKGFAVVATEVKELAKQTGAATDDIRSRIEGIQSSSAKAVNSIREISEVVEKVNLVATTIASAVEEQNLTTKEMARHIKETAEAAEDVSNAVSRTGNVAEEITSTISNVDQVIGRTVHAADDSLKQGNDLLRMASEMKDMIGQFKVEGRHRRAVSN